MDLVLQAIWSPKRPIAESDMLLHNTLKYRNLTESEFLAVLRSDPVAAERCDHVGYFPLHLLAIYTAWPTVTMIRELIKLNSAAASTRSVAGWMPLHLFCANAVARGETRPRVTCELLRALRAAYPQAASESLGNEKTCGVRTPAVLFPKIAFKGRKECMVVLEEDADACVLAEEAAAAQKESHAACLLQTVNSAADRGDIDGVCTALLQANGEYAGITDIADSVGGRVLMHRCFERCAQSLHQDAVTLLIASSPTAVFQPSNDMLPLHVLLACCDSRHLTPEMIKRLVELNPNACTYRGPRGWLPLHLWAARDPNSPDALSVVKELMKFVKGLRAARVRDNVGDLPLHIFCRTCSKYKFARDDEYHGALAIEDVDNEDESQLQDEHELDSVSVQWSAAQPRKLAILLLEAYPEAWNMSGGDDKTPMDLAPLELREAFLNFVYGHERNKEMLRLNKETCGDGDGAGQTDRMSIADAIHSGQDALLLELLENGRLSGYSHSDLDGGTCLHQLLRRPQAVGRDLVQAILKNIPHAARVSDNKGWFCLHLLCRRAVTDPKAGVPATIRCLLKAYKDATLKKCGGKRQQWTPLHVLCFTISRLNFRKEPLTGESREAFDARLLSFAASLAEAAASACHELDGRNRRPCDLLPEAPYFHPFRNYCGPQKIVIQRASPRSTSESQNYVDEKMDISPNTPAVAQTATKMAASSAETGTDEASAIIESHVGRKNASRSSRHIDNEWYEGPAACPDCCSVEVCCVTPTSTPSQVDRECFPFELPGVELTIESRPCSRDTHQVDECNSIRNIALPVLESHFPPDHIHSGLSKVVPLSSENATMHEHKLARKLRALEAERYAIEQGQLQRASESDRQTREELARRAALRAKTKERRKRERDRASEPCFGTKNAPTRRSGTARLKSRLYRQEHFRY